MLRRAFAASLACVVLAAGTVSTGHAQSPPAAAPAATPAPTLAVPPTEAGLLALGARKLGSADYTRLYIGNTLTGRATDGEGFHLFVESASAYRMEFQGKRTTERWRVGPAGEFCSVADGVEGCTREYEHEGTIYSFNEDGSLAGKARLRPGNPEGL